MCPNHPPPPRRLHGTGRATASCRRPSPVEKVRTPASHRVSRPYLRPPALSPLVSIASRLRGSDSNVRCLRFLHRAARLTRHENRVPSDRPPTEYLVPQRVRMVV